MNQPGKEIGTAQILHLVFAACIANMLVATSELFADDSISLRQEQGRITIKAGDQPVATYVYEDPQISRPYFAHVCAPGGIQVTRNHPPIPDQDAVDHATFHPGIWLAFGDLGGEDYWRNRAAVRHDRVSKIESANDGSASFTVQNSYCKAGQPKEVICHETCQYIVSIEPQGYLLICDSLFSSSKPFAFGDQEEMGLGVRMATKLTVKSGGDILDAEDRENEKEIWGKSAEWCDYSGMNDGREIGIMVIPAPENFRPSRYHVRNYGLLTANPFGQKAFGEAQPSRFEVAAGTPFRLRYAIVLHSTQNVEFDRQTCFRKVIRRLTKVPRPEI